MKRAIHKPAEAVIDLIRCKTEYKTTLIKSKPNEMIQETEELYITCEKCQRFMQQLKHHHKIPQKTG